MHGKGLPEASNGCLSTWRVLQEAYAMAYLPSACREW